MDPLLHIFDQLHVSAGPLRQYVDKNHEDFAELWKNSPSDFLEIILRNYPKFIESSDNDERLALETYIQ